MPARGDLSGLLWRAAASGSSGRPIIETALSLASGEALSRRANWLNLIVSSPESDIVGSNSNIWPRSHFYRREMG